jgi:hypothetical protein
MDRELKNCGLLSTRRPSVAYTDTGTPRQPVITPGAKEYCSADVRASELEVIELYRWHLQINHKCIHNMQTRAPNTRYEAYGPTQLLHPYAYSSVLPRIKKNAVF